MRQKEGRGADARSGHPGHAKTPIQGDKESPLSPAPKKSGFISAGANPLALDSVMAALIGFDISKITQIEYESDRG